MRFPRGLRWSRPRVFIPLSPSASVACARHLFADRRAFPDDWLVLGCVGGCSRTLIASAVRLNLSPPGEIVGPFFATISPAMMSRRVMVGRRPGRRATLIKPAPSSVVSARDFAARSGAGRRRLCRHRKNIRVARCRDVRGRTFPLPADRALLARHDMEQQAAQVDWARARKILRPPQEWFEGDEPKPF